MANTQSNITVLPTARPWNFAAIAPSAGAASSRVGYNANLTDGSNGGGTGVENQAFTYGQQHANGGETAPHTIACNPGDCVFVQYTGGTVKWSAAGTLYGPHGDASAASVVSPSLDYTDSNGYVQPTDCMPAAYNIARVDPTTGTGGIVGVFTDSGGNIIANSFWDWKSLVHGATKFSLTAVGNASGGNTVYTGTITGGVSGAYIGYLFFIAGFASSANNGLFECVGSSNTTLTLANAGGVAVTATGTALMMDTVILQAPAGASFLSIGIDDGLLHDNAGAGFNVTVSVMDASSYLGDETYPTRFPVGICCCANGADSMRTSAYMGASFSPLFDTSLNGWMTGYVGQLFPHGGQNSGGAPAGSNGQVFPY